MANIPIRWENSAQGKRARPNPYVVKVIAHLRSVAAAGARFSRLHVADQGCGKLRHFPIFRRSFHRIVLVDTRLQITRKQLIGGEKTTILRYVAKADSGGNRYCVVSSGEFGRSQLGLDVIFCICVFDVVPRSFRASIVKAAASNLRTGGYYCVIIPRNDQSITSRCHQEITHEDGYLFKRNSAATFYANFSADSSQFAHLSDSLRKAGFITVSDISVYRHACMICKKVS